MNILFLCTGNSCRSILAEAIFNHLAPHGFKAASAGSRPTGFVHPRTLELLADEGICHEGYYSKSLDTLTTTPDLIITVCANAQAEACPVFPGPYLRSHWGVDDPAQVEGTETEIKAAFRSSYQILRRRIEAFFALPLHDLKHNPEAFRVQLDGIGSLQPDTCHA